MPVELGVLGLRQVTRSLWIIRSDSRRIDHRWPKPGCIEVVADVVVILNGLLRGALVQSHCGTVGFCFEPKTGAIADYYPAAAYSKAQSHQSTTARNVSDKADGMIRVQSVGATL